MASIDRHRARDCYRIRYTVTVKDNRIRRPRYAKTREEANIIMGKATSLEAAMKSRVAGDEEIQDWINRELITAEEARDAFPGFADTSARTGAGRLEPTDYDQILAEYEEHAIRSSKAKDPMRRTHLNTMARAQRVLEWMRENHSDLGSLTVQACLDYSDDLDRRYAPWTRYHNMTALRLLLDQAVLLGMLNANPARDDRIHLGQPKTATVRRVLSVEEAKHILEVSLNHRDRINGAIPTIVRHGLYAGLRPEEMKWSMWMWLNPATKVLSVQKSVCAVNGEEWIPKDYESRILGVKDDYVDYLRDERERQSAVGITCPFMLPGKYAGKPIGVDAPQKAFAKMIRDEDLDPTITLYSLRHSFATELVRHHDIETVRDHLGQSDIRTTQLYLRALKAEDRATEALRY